MNEVRPWNSPTTRRLLDEAGVTSVLAVDRDVRFLTERPVPGPDVLEADPRGPAADRLRPERL
ncbi:hypothetical protein GCM10010415_43730 [Streptomyces atrovirens]